MARTKQNSGDKQAYTRIEDAFWKLLSERPYNKITIAALSKEAAVNHNLIYYYFDNIDDMAVQLLNKNMEGELPSRLLSILMKASFTDFNSFIDEPEAIKRIRRTLLYMRSDSSYLNQLIKERLQNEWLKSAGISKDHLIKENLIDLEFIFGGIISVIGNYSFEDSPQEILNLYSRPLGKGIIDTLKRFSE